MYLLPWPATRNMTWLTLLTPLSALFSFESLQMFKDSSRSPPELETVDNDDVEAEMVDDF